MSVATEVPRTAEPFVHPALFYRGPEEYLAGTLPFVHDGLAAGQPVAVAVPGPNLALLRGELGAAADRVQMLDMTRVGRNPGQIIPGVLRAFADRYPDGPVRIIGEPIWPGRSAVEYPACVQHEALINLAFAGRVVTILCPYDVEGLDPLVLADAEATHPVLMDGSGTRVSADYAPDRIVAEYNQPLATPAQADTLSFDAAKLAAVRRFAAYHATRAGLSADRIGDFRLVADELASNAVVHGGGHGMLHIWAENGHLVCEVSDAGRIDDPLVGRLPVADASTSGRGLLLVNHLSDLVRVHTSDGGTTVRAHLRI